METDVDERDAPEGCKAILAPYFGGSRCSGCAFDNTACPDEYCESCERDDGADVIFVRQDLSMIDRSVPRGAQHL